MHSLLVASSSALALRACPPQLVASSSAARAARSPTTARRCALGSSARAARSLALRARLLGGSRCALARAARSPATAPRTLLGARAARSPPRRLALRARSRCALARHSSSQAYRALVLLDGRSRKLPLPSVRSRLRPCGSEVLVRHRKTHRLAAPQTWCGASARPRLAAWSSIGSNVWNEPQQPPSPLTSQTTPHRVSTSLTLRRARGPFESGG